MHRPVLSTSFFALIVVCMVGLAGGGSLNVVAQDAATNEEVVRRYFDELHTEGNLDVADELIAPDAVFHTPDGDLQGPEGIVGLITALRGAFANPEFPIEDLVAADDMVVVRWTMNGTHEGDFQGIPPSGAEVSMDGMAFIRLEDGLIVENHIQYDRLGLLQQIGAIATPEAEATTGDARPLSINGAVLETE